MNSENVERLGLTPRELEILQRIADGLSTKEIAKVLFVSENTVKTTPAGCSARRMYDNPFMNAAIAFTEPFPIGLLVTAISAAVLRKQ